MTYILGSRCSQGVVLVADKKIIATDGGAEYKYNYKLFSELENMIIGYSGSRHIFDLFRNDLIDYVISYKDAYHEYPTIPRSTRKLQRLLIS